MSPMFAPARREQMRLRMALHGPAGSGKTLTSFMLARALSPDGRFAVIDTERRALEFADRFEFGHLAPTVADPEQLPKMLAGAANEGYGSVVVDSFTHYWSGTGGALDLVDRTSDKRAGWSKYRPVENAMMDALLSFPGHVLVTMRVKTDHVTEVDSNGRNKTRRVGLKPDQRDTVDYEFSVIGAMDDDHTLTVVKSTCEALADKRIARPGLDLADTIAEWLGQGEPMPDALGYRDRAVDPASSIADLRELHTEVKRRNLLGAAVIDEHGDSTTLDALIRRLGQERKEGPAASDAVAGLHLVGASA